MELDPTIVVFPVYFGNRCDFKPVSPFAKILAEFKGRRSLSKADLQFWMKYGFEVKEEKHPLGQPPA